VTPPPPPLANLTSGVRRRRANRVRAVGVASAAVAFAVAVPLMHMAPRPSDPADAQPQIDPAKDQPPELATQRPLFVYFVLGLVQVRHFHKSLSQSGTIEQRSFTVNA